MCRANRWQMGKKTANEMLPVPQTEILPDILGVFSCLSLLRTSGFLSSS